MRSQDEQTIWDELDQFPDQAMPWERNQLILENIRKERKKMQKMNKRRAYMSWATKGLITCAAILAMIWFKPFSSAVETESASKVAAEDQKYIKAAEQAIKGLGMNKVFRFEEVEKEKDYVIVRAENREAVVTLKLESLGVRSISAGYAVEELTSEYQPYVKTAQDAFKATNQNVSLQEARYFKNEEGVTLNFTVKGHKNNRQYVRVNLKTNQVKDYKLNYQVANVEKKYIDLAEKALKSYSNLKTVTFTEAQKSKRESEVWRFTNEPANYLVEVDAGTSQILRVDYTTDEYLIPTLESVIPVTKPLIQDVFGIDLTGYQAYGGEDWGGYVLKAEGKPRIVVLMGDMKRGNIASIYLE